MPSTNFADLPEFIPSDAQTIVNEWKAAYVSKINRPLLPMQTEAILCEVFAGKEKTLIDKYNAGGRTQLLDFSTAPMLDYLVALTNTTRLDAQFSSTVLEFVIITGHTGVTIPAGTRIRSADGKAIFATTSTKFVPAGTYLGTVDGVCLTAGEVGNGYAVGSVNSILDPLVFVISCTNTTLTAGGSDAESDEQLVIRAQEAADKFSTAGSVGAYKFWAKSAHPSIVDVAVIGPQDADFSFDPGTVHLFPLVTGGGVTPTPILNAVLSTCSDELVRPLCELVFADSPTAVSYDIDVDLTTFDWSIDEEVIANVGQLLNDYAQGRKKALALDVIVAKIEAISMQAEVYNVVVNLPVADISLLKNQYAEIGIITVNIIAHHV